MKINLNTIQNLYKSDCDIKNAKGIAMSACMRDNFAYDMELICKCEYCPYEAAIIAGHDKKCKPY